LLIILFGIIGWIFCGFFIGGLIRVRLFCLILLLVGVRVRVIFDRNFIIVSVEYLEIVEAVVLIG
jgi:hypothetical protein